MKLYISFFLLFFFYSYGQGQDYSSFDCPVIQDGKTLKYAFTGGFNAPQFSNADLNQDGIMDLFVFDRAGHVPLTFEYSGDGLSEGYSFTRKYRSSLPDSLISWAKMRDYNMDGIPDLFVAPTYAGISSVTLYVGSVIDGKLSYELKRIGNPNGPYDIIWYPNGSDWINVSAPFTDVPEIIDVDFDGDLDLLSFDGGGSYVTYYKNLQVEEGLSKNEMKFIVGDRCFGKFKESGTSGNLFLSNDPSSCASKFKDDDPLLKGGGAHAGSTIMGFDNDGDEDLELVLGDLNGSNLVYVHNAGTNTANYMDEVSYSFPEYDASADMDIFLAAYNVDVNGDGLADVLASPNSTKSAQNHNNIWYYQNTGDPENRFVYQQNNFLSEETIDLGYFSEPVFMDEDADGLMDILVASGGYYEGQAKINMFLSLYRNTGTKKNPEFTLVDSDYIGFSEYNTSSNNPSLAVGDLDGDGDMDLLIGDQEGSLYYYSNTAGADQPMQFGNPRVNYMDINIDKRGRPAIEDINGDGLADIIIGERNLNGNTQDPDNPYFGSVAYYQNIGSIGSPMFNPNLAVAPNNPALGQMRTQVYTSNAEANSSAPAFIRVEGELQVLLGSESGRIKRYAVDGQNPGSKFLLIDSIVGGIDEGSHTTLDSYDIDDDGYLEIIVGNLRGGLSFFNTDIKSQSTSIQEISISEEVRLFPNPTNTTLTLVAPPTLQLEEITLIASDGKQVNRWDGSQRILDITAYPTGVYHLAMYTREKAITKKVIIF